MARKSKENPRYKNKTTLTVYLVLRALIILALVRAVFRREYQSVFLCALSLGLMVLPSILSKKLKVVLPSTLEVIILLFIYAAEILGEMNAFYVRVPHWDTMLHTINGFLCAAIGFCLVDMMNRNERFSFRLSPLYLAIVSFCFSMTVGVLWEFFEFSGDYFLGMDMQKDTIITWIASTEFDPTRSNTAVVIDGIRETLVNGSPLPVEGYLDIGLIDTLADMFVNFIGAVVFSVIGFFYVKHRGEGRIARHFIPVLSKTKDQTAQEESPENPEQ